MKMWTKIKNWFNPPPPSYHYSANGALMFLTFEGIEYFALVGNTIGDFVWMYVDGRGHPDRETVTKLTIWVGTQTLLKQNAPEKV